MTLLDAETTKCEGVQEAFRALEVTPDEIIDALDAAERETLVEMVNEDDVMDVESAEEIPADFIREMWHEYLIHGMGMNDVDLLRTCLGGREEVYTLREEHTAMSEFYYINTLDLSDLDR